MSLAVIAVPEGKIVDFVDGKYRDDKPEERVRQAISKRLVNSLAYPKSRIEIERAIKVGSARKRVDIAIFREGSTHEQSDIQIIVECKSEKVAPADRNEGVEQLKSYMAASLNCVWGIWTNGTHREVWEKVTDATGTHAFVERVDIPGPDGRVAEGRRRQQLTKATGDALMYAFKSSHAYIHTVDGFQKEKAFFELLKVIFCKIADEKNVPKPLEFHVASGELVSSDGQLACAARIKDIFQRVKKNFPQIFNPNDEIELNPRSLVRIVSELQSYSLLASDIDIKGKAYEEIVGSNLKGDRGQFFTPRNVMRMAVEMVAPTIDDRVVDPACGTGGFLVTSMLSSLQSLRADFGSELSGDIEQWPHDLRAQYDSRVAEIVESNYFGFDISPELVRAAKMNMVMNNDGSGNMLQTDSLLPPFRWSLEFRTALASALNRGNTRVTENIGPADFTSSADLGKFDVLVTNPPFGSKIVIRDTEVLEQFDLGHIWEKGATSWTRTGRLQAGVPPEQLFVERCVQFLRPGGRMAIVLPDSILGSPGLEYIRQWLLSEVRIIASIDLSVDTFQPHVGVQTSVLVVEKKTLEEKVAEDARGGILPYEVFMALVEKVGHDKRGLTTYVRDIFGDEVLAEVIENVPQDDGSWRSETRLEKVVDDQTHQAAELFAAWKAREGIAW